MNIYKYLHSIKNRKYIIKIIYILVTLIILYFSYLFVIKNWFSNNGVIKYDVFMNNFIQVVSKDNYFMNYGLWDYSKDAKDTLFQANRRLVDYILEKSEVLGKTNIKILDVGCGYGEQDFYWSSIIDKTNTITAIDISEYQIQEAKKKSKEIGSTVSFEICDAMHIDKRFNNGEFNTVLCVESAFHYDDRPLFFKSVYNVLEQDGTFVICDIVLNDTYTPGILNSGFLRIFSDFLHIPQQNHIKKEEWKNTIRNSGLKIVDCIDITDKTFKPYYNNCFHIYIERNYLPKSLASSLYNFFAYVQPFSYMVAVCKK